MVAENLQLEEYRFQNSLTWYSKPEHQDRDLHIGTSARESELEKENNDLRQQLIEAQSKIIRLVEFWPLPFAYYNSWRPIFQPLGAILVNSAQNSLWNLDSRQKYCKFVNH